MPRINGNWVTDKQIAREAALDAIATLCIGIGILVLLYVVCAR